MRLVPISSCKIDIEIIVASNNNVSSISNLSEGLRQLTNVCMYRGRPSGRCLWNRAFQLGQGEGPIGIVGPISQPHGTNGTASLTLDHAHALVCVF